MEGDKYVFHYTEDHLAQQIAEDEHFLVGPGAQFGPGIYATDLAPEDATPDEIRDICFGGDAADVAFNGVLVLLADDPFSPFVEVDRRVFLLSVEAVGEVVPIHALLVAVGTREPHGVWKIEPWP